MFASARPDERGYVVDPKIVFKGEAIDKQGQLIGKHELWRKVGSRFNRTLFPGFTDTGRLRALIRTRAEREGITEEQVEKNMKALIPAGRFGPVRRIPAEALTHLERWTPVTPPAAAS